ncbi:hypothetical protein AUK22_09650 [bacterium CG2_30_54_10]|nr:MAG: hypothetical protein AUK22_09650 [bacterium CG2_30_54_10]
MNGLLKPALIAVLMFSLSGALPGAVLAADLSHKISLDFRDTDIRDVFKLVAEKAGLGLVVDKSIRGNVTLRIINAPVSKALDTIALATGYEWFLMNDNVVVCDEKKLPTRSIVRPLLHISVHEAFKALMLSIKRDLKAWSLENNSIILTARPDILIEAERLLASIDKPRRHFLGTIKIMQGNKVLQFLDFHGTPGEQVTAFDGSKKGFPGGADQPPRVYKAGLNLEFSPEIRSGSEALEGAISLDNTWVDGFEGALPVTMIQKIATVCRTTPGKPVKIGKFGKDREMFFSFAWE